MAFIPEKTGRAPKPQSRGQGRTRGRRPDAHLRPSRPRGPGAAMAVVSGRLCGERELGATLSSRVGDREHQLLNKVAPRPAHQQWLIDFQMRERCL